MTTKIEWTEETWNPTSGCDRVSPGCDHCLAPETRILYEDMTWRRLDEAIVGDRLVAVDDELAVGANRKLRVATVEAVWRTWAPTIEMHVGSRQVVASPNHRWLARVRPSWRTTESLRLGVELRTMTGPVEQDCDEDYMAGYIVGATVGDGTMRFSPGQRSNSTGVPQAWWRVAEPEFDRPLLLRLRLFLAHFGVLVEVRSFDAGVSGFEPAAGRVSMLKVETRALGHLAIIHDLMARAVGSLDWKAGWVAGLYDTDGSFDGSVRVSQSKSNGALEQWAGYVGDLGFSAKVERWEGGACPTVRLEGGLTDRLEFFAAVRPALMRKTAHHYGQLAEFGTERVSGLLAGPHRELVDIQTSTGTFVAEGIVTHNCYALTLAGRLKAMGQAHYQADGDPRTSGPGFGLTIHPDALDKPFGWRKPRTVFVNSMSDLFHPDVPETFIGSVWNTMDLTPHHTYQILTKRPQRMASLLSGWAKAGWTWRRHDLMWCGPIPGPLLNVWAGTSIENDRYAFRADHLRATPAAIRFISYEPALGPVPSLDLTGIDWLICGAESGRGARLMDVGWAREIKDKCVEAGVAFFLKQYADSAGHKISLPELDGQQWTQMPKRGAREYASKR